MAIRVASEDQKPQKSNGNQGGEGDEYIKIGTVSSWTHHHSLIPF
jgi:hypothetical protein